MITLQQFGNVPENLADNALYTISIVNEIFAAFPNAFRFTSGYRSPSQNAAANGVSNSYHLKALAADFVPNNGNFNQYKAGIVQILNKYGYELVTHNVGSGMHFHIEPSPRWGGISQLPNSNSNNSIYAVVALVAIVFLLSD